jgi:hypothetical protein
VREKERKREIDS